MHFTPTMYLLAAVITAVEGFIGLRLKGPPRWLFLALSLQELIKINTSLFGTAEMYFYAYWLMRIITVTLAAYVSGWACSLAIPRVKAWTFYAPPVVVGILGLSNIMPAYPRIWYWFICSQMICVTTILIGCIFSIGRKYRNAALALGLLFLISAGAAVYWAAFGKFSLVPPLVWLLGLGILLRTSSSLSGTSRIPLSL